LFGLVSCLAMAGDMYRWEDEQGRVYYSDQPPPPAARNVRRKPQSRHGEYEALPYRLQVVVDKYPVTLYVTDCGGPCDRARELMMQRGVPHTLLDPSEAQAREQLMALTGGQLEVPVVEVGKTVLRGFEEGQWNAALDAAGYPGYAIIDVKPYIPQPAKRSGGQSSDAGGVAPSDSAGLESAQAEPGELESDEDLVEDVNTGDLANEDAAPADINQDE
jgi:hypothetical protein